MKRFFALLLCTVLLLTMFPVSAVAAKAEPKDIWEQITELENQAVALRGASTAEARAAAYSGIVDQIIETVESSERCVPGSIVRHGDFFYWDEIDGTACGYSPRLRAQIREGADPDADPEAFSGIDTVSYTEKGGYPYSLNVAAFQPYKGIDSSFTAQYENRCNNIAQALGGTGTTYKTNNATIDNIAHAIETCAVVIFDSHGDTDYANGYDYTSHANTSYICLQSGSGITNADMVTVQGPYGSYKHAYYAGSYGQMQYYCVDGTAISNHMTSTSPNGLLWMAICLGMATDGMQAPLRARGVEVVYGYSQSVTFSGDYAWEAKFWPKMTAGSNVKDAIAYMKQQVGCPDPYTSSYPAYPIVVSSEDVYPGHGNVDANQTVHSTWTLYPQYTITAVSNNTAWGTVKLQGNQITAMPKNGYYADDYEVIEGAAAVTRSGNVFTVEAQSDCTVQINFAPRDPAVVHFSVPDGVSCAQINAYVGDEITLPAPEGEPSAEGYTFRFLGWITAPMEEDSLDAPAFLSAGSKVKLTTTDLTYYALYSYFVAMDGLDDDQFLRVDEAPHSWAGEYAITYQGALGLDASGDNVSTAIGSSNAVVDLGEKGCTYEGNILSGVTNDITFVVAPADNGTYTIKMKNHNYYLALGSDSNGLTTYTSSNTDKTRWIITYGSDGPVLTNAMFSERSLQYNASANLFRCYSSAQKPLTLFKKADGETWYTTDPKDKTACNPHTFGDWITEDEPTCTESGSKSRVCSVCGYKETEVLEALGHDYADVVTLPTCIDGGFTTHTCSRCGDSYTDAETQALGHDWDDGVFAVEPSAEADGVKVFTCARCGETREETVLFRFDDVQDESAYFYEPVYWALRHDPQITQGVSETMFGPNATCTRAQVVTFLWRAAGEPEPTASANPFTDVKESDYFYKAVLWALEKGITDGVSDTSFAPNQTCTRGQVVTFLWRAAGEPKVEAANPFDDVKESDYFYHAVLWAVSKQITTGTGDAAFSPADTCTRGQVVTFLFRADSVK